MALNTKKISQFPLREELNGEEYLMIASNGQTFRVKASVILGTLIKSIEQTLVEGDEAESTITIKTRGEGENERVMNFTVKNGSRGSVGPTGNKGPKGDRGDSGIIINNVMELEDILTSDLNSTSTTLGLSAAAGKILATKISDKEEKYLHSQEAFDLLQQENNIMDNVKYYIYDEDDVTQEEIDEELANISDFEGA